jgi:phthiocerol/phenolphthiocerol synthesis type-I polyketide synthase E
VTPGAVAVVGLAGRFPGAGSVDELWEAVLAGREVLTRFDAAQLAAEGVADAARPDYVPVRGVLDGVELFDAALFGYSPREAELIDPQQRLLLECAWAALEHAGHAAGGRVGVFAGTSISTYLLRNLAGELAAGGDLLPLVLGNDKDHAAARIAYRLGLTGPALAVQTACSTSLVAVHQAVQSLRAGECDLALAGGAAVELPQRAGYVFEPHGIAAPDGHCRAFDERAAGTVAGSGVALVVLRRAEDADADGDTVHALIRGSAVNNDGGGKVGYTAPSVDGQADVVRAALRASGVDARSIGYVETHGTGTPLGDAVEIAALTEAFRDWTADTGFCGIGSVKPNIGHLDAAAGVTGLIKAVLALRHATLPPTIHCERPNPALGLDGTPFHPVTAAAPWPVRAGERRRCGVSSFGMGGTNAHVVLEEAVPVPAPDGPARPVLVVQSGRTPGAVRELGDRLVSALAGAGPALPDAAYTLQVGRTPLAARRAVVAATPAELAERLAAEPVREVPRASTVGFLFPGQGAQFAGMAAGAYGALPEFRRVVDECLDQLDPAVRGLLLGSSTVDTTDTALGQPGLFVVEYALARQLVAWGLRPSVLLGHSVGEYAAACLAGAVALPDALRLVARRGELMARTAPGAMLAVLAPEEQVRAGAGGLAVAAVNAPDVLVLSGPPAEVDAAAERFAGAGVRTRRLPARYAFHSAAVDPVLADFRAAAAAVPHRPGSIPVLTGLTGQPVPRRGWSAEHWVRQLREPVRFGPALARLLAMPNPVLVEVGPGRTLTALALRQGAGTAVGTVPAGSTDPAAVHRAVLQAVGTAWSAGAPVDWAAFAAAMPGAPGRRVPLPTYPFERARHWVDPPGTRSAATPEAPEAPEAGAGDGADVQARLAEIWRRLLGVTDLTAASDFFALGGHSLLAVPLLAGIQAAFGVTLSLREAQDAPTLGAQAELVRERLRCGDGGD